MDFTNKEVNDAEEAVVKLSEAFKISDKEVVHLLIYGFTVKYKSKLPTHVAELVEELKATFDTY